MGEPTTYSLASIPSRFIALIIDNILTGVVAGIAAALSLGLLAPVAGLLVGVAYQWYFLTHNDGQTPGKQILGIRVIKVDGTEITDFDAIMRYLGYYINSAFILIGWVWALIDENQQGWHDKLARTYVVNA